MKSATNLLSERFEVAFNKIQDSLENLLKIYNRGFTDLVRIAASRHKMIQEFQDDLFQFARLRNAIVHEKIEVGYYIAEPHERVVILIEKIADLLSKPNYGLSIATKNVVYFQIDDPLLKVIKTLRKNEYSRFPIYDKNECIGLLNTRKIVKWFAENMTNSSIELDNVRVSDIFVRNQKHPIVFVPKSYTIFDIEDVYEEYHKNKEKLEMAIITENGRRTEKPLGVVTAWDLIEIDYALD